MQAQTLSGIGMHTGAPCSVTLARNPGPVAFAVDGHRAAIEDIVVVDGTRSTTISVQNTYIRTVEHLLAAFAGAGVRSGVTIEVQGPELPLLDGAAGAWAAALARLEAPTSQPRIVVAREGTVEIGESLYAFVPDEETVVRVDLDLDDARLVAHAEWTGDADDFRTRIANARTFTLEKHIHELESLGVVKHVEPESVVVIGEAIGFKGQPFRPDEPARHKLIDLLGDAYLYGGPPRGRLTVHRPGHTANHGAFRLALERGIVVKR